MGRTLTRMELVRGLLQRAILTLAVIPDPDLRFRTGPRTAWPGYVQETRDAYAAAPAVPRRYVPTPRDLTVFLDVLSWLEWFRRQSDQNAETAKVFTAWAFGAPRWLQQQITTTNRNRRASKQLVHDRRNEMLAAIIARFPVGIESVRLATGFDKVDEVYDVDTSNDQSADLVQSDLTDLPTSPKFVRAPDAKAYGYSHPEAAKARAADRESAKSGELANRRYARAGQKNPRKRKAPRGKGDPAGSKGPVAGAMA